MKPIGRPVFRKHFFCQFFVVLLSFFLFFGCSDSDSDSNNQEMKAVDSISVEPSSASIPYGETQKLTVIGTFKDGSSGEIKTELDWHTSDTEIVTVSDEGVAISKSVGSAEITASHNGMTAVSAITVTPTSYSLDENRNKALLGPIADSMIQVYRLTDLYLPIVIQFRFFMARIML